MLPLAVALIAASVLVPRLLGRWGAPACVLVGLGAAAGAMTVIALVAHVGAGAGWLVPAMLLIAAGMGFGLVGLQYIAVSGTTDEDAGIASGVQRAADQLGGASGVAVYVGIGFAPAVHAVDPFLVASALAIAGLVVGAVVVSRPSVPDGDDASSLAPHTGVRSQTGRMTDTSSPRQLRLIIETDDFDAAVAFYRDVLGMPEQPAFATTGDDRVAILHAGAATIELATAEHTKNIDAVEGAPHEPGPSLRIALEVDDTEKAVAAAQGHGLRLVAPPVETPFRTINARIDGPAGWKVTFFQELETLEERSAREGFTTDDRRER
jgi:catechol 2,3-dioxygenase-like lactoylglutathione lyase family enzyme